MSQAPTLEELGIDDPDEFNRRQRERLSDALDEAMSLNDDESEALDILRGAAPDTATVEINGRREVEVKAHCGEAERRALMVAADDLADGSITEDEYLTFLEQFLAYMVETEGFTAEVWRAYRREFGSDELLAVYETVMQPYLDRRGAITSFRGDDDGDDST